MTSNQILKPIDEGNSLQLLTLQQLVCQRSRCYIGVCRVWCVQEFFFLHKNRTKLRYSCLELVYHVSDTI